MADLIEAANLQEPGLLLPVQDFDYKRLAKKANQALESDPRSSRYRVDTEHVPSSILFSKVKGTVLYAGSGPELSPLFLFPNAQSYIFQDVFDQDILRALESLGSGRVIRNLETVSDDDTRGVSIFEQNGARKRLIEIHGNRRKTLKNENLIRSDNEGLIGLNVPPETAQDLEVIYFHGLPYPDTIKALELSLLPRLKMGGLFVGPYPFYDGSFAGATPEQLGLTKMSGTYVKTSELSESEIEARIGYNLDQYKSEIDEGKAV